jgi:hypothetical protein
MDSMPTIRISVEVERSVEWNAHLWTTKKKEKGLCVSRHDGRLDVEQREETGPEGEA